jgi:uncharacterized membrane protein YqjE
VPALRVNALPGSLRALGANLLALACDRVELIGLELQEEKARTQRQLVLAAVAAVSLAAGTLLATLWVVMLFWDTHRLLVAGAIACLYAGIGGWALLSLRKMNRESAPPFAATMREFTNDLKLLRGRDE